MGDDDQDQAIESLVRAYNNYVQTKVQLDAEPNSLNRLEFSKAFTFLVEKLPGILALHAKIETTVKLLGAADREIDKLKAMVQELEKIDKEREASLEKERETHRRICSQISDYQNERDH